MTKIQLIKASGDMQTVDLPAKVKTVGDIRKHLNLDNTTRVILGGKELSAKESIKANMKLVVIPKEEQGL